MKLNDHARDRSVGFARESKSKANASSRALDGLEYSEIAPMIEEGEHEGSGWVPRPGVLAFSLKSSRRPFVRLASCSPSFPHVYGISRPEAQWIVAHRGERLSRVVARRVRAPETLTYLLVESPRIEAGRPKQC